MERQTLTVNELAAYLGVYNDLVYQQVKKNEIPHFRVGGKILFLKDSIDNWIIEQERTAKR